jgi:hypothetical protein
VWCGVVGGGGGGGGGWGMTLWPSKVSHDVHCRLPDCECGIMVFLSEARGIFIIPHKGYNHTATDLYYDHDATNQTIVTTSTTMCTLLLPLGHLCRIHGFCTGFFFLSFEVYGFIKV